MPSNPKSNEVEKCMTERRNGPNHCQCGHSFAYHGPYRSKNQRGRCMECLCDNFTPANPEQPTPYK